MYVHMYLHMYVFKYLAFGREATSKDYVLPPVCMQYLSIHTPNKSRVTLRYRYKKSFPLTNNEHTDKGRPYLIKKKRKHLYN